jgi:hypothetical protein
MKKMPPSDDRPTFDDADRRIAEALGRLPSPPAPGDLPSRVRARVGRRRVLIRSGALAAAAATLFLAWHIWPPARDAGRVVEDKSTQEALVAQWDKLLDEAAALPPVVVDLNILETQRAWVSIAGEAPQRVPDVGNANKR